MESFVRNFIRSSLLWLGMGVTLGLWIALAPDACCGGALPIEEAAIRHDVPLQVLLDELSAHKSGATRRQPSEKGQS